MPHGQQFSPVPPDDLDVLVIGAGLSGIAAGYYLQTLCKNWRYAIVEARDRLGGTWDLFRYPGIRSDSDMYTLGFAFRPWKSPKAIADGPAILAYLQDCARDYGIDEKMHFGLRVQSLHWSSKDARWLVILHDSSGKERQVRCRFIFSCSGYYRYDRGHTPHFDGRDDFAGTIIHPQHWPEGLVYDGKKVVVIGSGATAITLAPTLAKRAKIVSLLQRSPSYVVSRPSRDAKAEWLREKLPAQAAYKLARAKNVLFSAASYTALRRMPQRSKTWLMKEAQRQLGESCSVTPHFDPSYAPWDQRLCMVPDGDLFKAIGSGRVKMVTDRIDHINRQGISLCSGKQLDAEIIVTATGLELQFLGGASLFVDDKEVDAATLMTYRGMMLSSVPNMMFASGYTNASWTLKVDLTCKYACRILKHLERGGYRHCVPTPTADLKSEPLIDLTAGYIERSRHLFPSAGDKRPWRLYQNYLADMATLRFGAVDDGHLRFVQ